MPKTYSIRQPRRCANGAEFYLRDIQTDRQMVGSINAAVQRKIDETLATYGSRRTRRMLDKMMRAPKKKQRERRRT